MTVLSLQSYRPLRVLVLLTQPASLFQTAANARSTACRGTGRCEAGAGQRELLQLYSLWQRWAITLDQCHLWADKTGVPILTLSCQQGWAGAPFCRSLGLQGECEEVPDCLCLCYDIRDANTTEVTSAYFGELGYELVLFTPYVHYLHSIGKLVASVGPKGSSPFMYYSPNHTEASTLHS